MIPYGRHDVTGDDIDAVVSVLKSDFLTQGPNVEIFENSVATKVGANHAIAVNSATSALHIACLALGLSKGDWLWTTPISFVASANCGLYCGARIDFVDIDERYNNICPDRLEEKLIFATKKNCLPKILIAVHLSGQPCEMEKIYKLSIKYGFNVIEDASHAIGAKYKGDYVGSCRYCDITIFSFHPVKIITTGEGGMALTNSALLADKMSLLRSHGITRERHQMTRDSDGPWYYQQIDLGFNYRMTELQAALGISQLRRLDAYVRKRNELAERYNKHLTNLPISLPETHTASYSARHLYVIRLHLQELKLTHLEIFDSLREAEIGVNLHYIPIHLQPYYSKYGFKSGDFPNAENYYKTAITLPLYPKLKNEEQDYVVKILKGALS